MARQNHNKPIIEDSNIVRYIPLISPAVLRDEVPSTDAALTTVVEGRETIKGILRGEDSRKIIIVGPCSIHDPVADRDYAERLMELSKKVDDVFVLVKRTYFEKPRTTVGWKGLINEPHLDKEEKVNEGLKLARQILLQNAEMGLLSGTEFLEPFVPQYIADLVVWAAIGARTTQSSTHRQMVSGLSMPTGFKNSTQGDIKVAIDAVIASRQPQWFFGTNQYGTSTVVISKGNKSTHLILRGSEDTGPNYDAGSVARAQSMLARKKLAATLMIDCSHGNSEKDHNLQPAVFEAVMKQVYEGNNGIVGLMLESNIHEGRQDIEKDKELKYGVSITDACISWGATEALIMDAYKTLKRKG